MKLIFILGNDEVDFRLFGFENNVLMFSCQIDKVRHAEAVNIMQQVFIAVIGCGGQEDCLLRKQVPEARNFLIRFVIATA